MTYDTTEMAKQYLGRFRPEWKEIPALSGFEQLLKTVAVFIQAPQNVRAEIEGPGTLSVSGVNQELRARLSKIVVPELRRIQRLVQDRTADMKRERLALARPQVDPADTASALLRQEVRAFLRGLNDNERLVVLTGTADSVMQEAVLGAPAILSGLTPDGRAQVEKCYMQAQHGAALAVLEQREEALTLLRTAVGVAVGQVQHHAGLAPDIFAEWFAEVGASSIAA